MPKAAPKSNGVQAERRATESLPEARLPGSEPEEGTPTQLPMDRSALDTPREPREGASAARYQMTTPGLRTTLVAMLAAATASAACSAPAVPPPSSSIEAAGLIADARFYDDRVVYTLESGRTWEAQTGTFRTVMDWGVKLLVAGQDANGRWIATFGTQAGLPDTCYFTPEPGTEWRDGIAIAGVLFPKAPGFSFATPALGRDYPIGTRFCFNLDGQVSSVIPN